jgi:DNA-binding beta-propeller fold protein YncE
MRLVSIAVLAALCFSYLITSCQPNSGKVQEQNTAGFYYNLDKPDEVFKMDKKLREISGISWLGNDRLACIEDENGIIYVFDMKQQKLSAMYKFGGSGDYEDIAVKADTAWVLASNGVLYRVNDFMNSSRETIKIPTPLKSRNNTEGLTFDKTGNDLLIACKYEPSLKGKKSPGNVRAVYRFDVRTMKLQEEPGLLVDNRQADTEFRPSGIAVNPIDHEIYIISTAKGMLITVDESGEIRHVRTLNGKVFSQPEGICFSPNGDMYISNEGRTGPGTILKFKYRVHE